MYLQLKQKSIKTILTFLILTIFVGCNTSSQDEIKIDNERMIFITKTNEGFNIYSNTQKLILEYTKQNCDSSTLKILDDIWFASKEFYNVEPIDENKTTSQSITLNKNFQFYLIGIIK